MTGKFMDGSTCRSFDPSTTSTGVRRRRSAGAGSSSRKARNHGEATSRAWAAAWAAGVPRRDHDRLGGGSRVLGRRGAPHRIENFPLEFARGVRLDDRRPHREGHGAVAAPRSTPGRAGVESNTTKSTDRTRLATVGAISAPSLCPMRPTLPAAISVARQASGKRPRRRRRNRPGWRWHSHLWRLRPRACHSAARRRRRA